MKFNNFVLLVIGIGIIILAVDKISYNYAMAPTWAEIERNNASVELSIRQANAQADAETHQTMAAALGVGSWVLVGLVLAIGGTMFVYVPWHKRQESLARAVDGLFALQDFSNGQVAWKVDPNRSLTGTHGFAKQSGLLGEFGSNYAGPDRQLSMVTTGERTRTMAAKQITERPNRTSAMAEAGVFDEMRREKAAKAQLAENRLLSSQRQPDPIALPSNYQLLTVNDALEQSTETEWVLGQNQDTGELYKFNIREVVHMGIVGATGTGKTTYVALLMIANALRARWRVIVLDGKGGADWSKFSGFVEYHALDYTTVGEYLGQIAGEYQRRQAKLNEASANSIWELTPMPRPTMVLVDEFGSVMDSLKVADSAQHKSVSLELGNLLRLSRSTGISMVFCDQDPSKWPSAMRANLPVNICFKLGGMKGNSVAEYNLNELDRTGHFQVNGERYHAWPTYRVIDSLLPSADYRRPKALLTECSGRSVRSDRIKWGEGTPVDSTPTSERTNERTCEPTDRQRALKEWRAANPGNERGIQARAIRELQEQGIDISKAYVCEMWESCAPLEAEAE